MKKFPRFNEYKILVFRILLVYVFYFIARLLFFIYNVNLIKIDGVIDFFRLCYHGLTFDTTAILYVNSLFILLSVLPLVINTKRNFQRFLLWLYFGTNLLAYATNFIDFIYYRYSFNRSTRAAVDTLQNESNKSLLLVNFLHNYWHVFLLFFGLSYI